MEFKDLSKREQEMVLHALGIKYEGKHVPFRNFYTVHRADEVMDRLLRKGIFKKDPPFQSDDYIHCRVTKEWEVKATAFATQRDNPGPMVLVPKRIMDALQSDWAQVFIDMYRATLQGKHPEPGSFEHALEELQEMTFEVHECDRGLPSSVIEALNSGDGSYRP